MREHFRQQLSNLHAAFAEAPPALLQVRPPPLPSRTPHPPTFLTPLLPRLPPLFSTSSTRMCTCTPCTHPRGGAPRPPHRRSTTAGRGRRRRRNRRPHRRRRRRRHRGRARGRTGLHDVVGVRTDGVRAVDEGGRECLPRRTERRTALPSLAQQPPVDVLPRAPPPAAAPAPSPAASPAASAAPVAAPAAAAAHRDRAASAGVLPLRLDTADTVQRSTESVGDGSTAGAPSRGGRPAVVDGRDDAGGDAGSVTAGHPAASPAARRPRRRLRRRSIRRTRRASRRHSSNASPPAVERTHRSRRI